MRLSSSGWSDLFVFVRFVLAICSLAHGCQLVDDLFNPIGPEMNVLAVPGNSDQFNKALAIQEQLVADFPPFPGIARTSQVATATLGVLLLVLAKVTRRRKSTARAC